MVAKEQSAMTKARSILSVILAGVGLSVSGADLHPGMPAPPFRAQDQNGKSVALADFKGKSTVVLYFYPKDDTPGCTKEACSLRDGFKDIQKAGAVILGVSADSVDSHAAFAAKFSLPFSILADPEHRIIEAYGVKMAMLGMAKRVTFIIGKDGVIRNIVQDVKAAEHDKQVLELLGKP
jgi:thioredoxin-dependent peroxiredoxin